MQIVYDNVYIDLQFVYTFYSRVSALLVIPLMQKQKMWLNRLYSWVVDSSAL